MLFMKYFKLFVASMFVAGLLGSIGTAADKPKKLTCCQEAQAKKAECSHKCCIAAHKAGKSCEKCNPNKEDLKKEPKPGGK